MNKIRYAKNAKKAVCVLTAGMMILSAGALTGCKKNEGSQGGNAIVDQQEAMKTLAYKVTDVSVDAELDRSVTFKNGKFYGVASTYDNNGSDNYFYDCNIVIFDETGTVSQTIPVFKQVNETEYGGVSGNLFVTDEGNITCIVYKGSWDEETGESTSSNELVTYDSQGNTVSTVDISNVVTEEEQNNENMWLQDFLVDAQGNIYLNLYSCVRVCDSTGNVLFTTEKMGDNAWSNGIILTNKGVPALHMYSYDDSGSKTMLKEISIEKKGFGAEYDLSSLNLGNVYNGSGNYLAFTTTDTGISGVNADTLELEQVINLLNLGVDNSNIQSFSALENGDFVTLGRDYSRYGNSKTILNILKPVDSSEVKEKKILSLGCFYLDWRIRSQIANFNKTSEDYVIYATSYSESNDTSDWSAAQTKFNNEILAGNVPDILLVNDSMPYASYASKGLFADLYEIMEQDGEYTKDSFVPSVLNALEKDGKLYSMAMGFNVSTYAAKTSKVGTEQSITMDKANEILASMPEGAMLTSYSSTMSSTDYLGTALQFLNFVDYEKAECYFDTPDFKAVLETAAKYPKEIDYDAIWNDNPNYWQEQESACKEDRALLYNMYLSDFSSYTSTRDAYFREDITMVGYPGISEENPGGAYMSLGTRIAVSSKSKFKEAGWEFIKKIIKESVTEEEVNNYSYRSVSSNSSSTTSSDDSGVKKKWVSNYYNFPVLKEQLDLLANQATIPDTYIDEEGKEVVSENIWYVGNEQVTVSTPTQADVDLVKEYVSNIKTCYYYDQSLTDIINEEAAAYFNGTKSVDETTAIIQSKAKIYLSEQYG